MTTFTILKKIFLKIESLICGIYINKVIYIKQTIQNTSKWNAKINQYRNISFQWIVSETVFITRIR